VWDFGGQDIYLGTHSLFLDDRAIYLLVWTPQTEREGPAEDAGLIMQHRRLDYWLDYLRALVGTSAPIVVTQSQCDLESLAREAPVPEKHGFTWLRRTTCSAAREHDGMEQLWPTLKAAARLLLERHGEVRLPCSWVAIDDSLRELAAV
jgi:internalin A